ncbi:MAG: Rossmann-like and DUF2520 domain-containing protein [Bacteroidales bacterium]
MDSEQLNKRYSFSFIGYGNVAYRLAITLKKHGHRINYICGRESQKAEKLAYILNKEEHSSTSQVHSSLNYADAAKSEIVILAVSDSAISKVASEFYSICTQEGSFPLVLHCSGATPLDVLKEFPKHGVLYPLMTLSATKPVDFSLIPFFLESSSKETSALLKNICYSLNSEYREIDSNERAQLHVSAVYMSNFINYLTGLAFDLSKPNHMFLMPLAIETLRKAFLYEHPALVQTGPAIRGDIETINKHLKLLDGFPEHKEIYELLTGNISKRRKQE